MSIRHESRKILMQSMYELDIRSEINAGAQVFKDILTRNVSENKEMIGEDRFVFDLADMVQERLITIDEIIKKAAPEWPIEKINIVDRNILRIGLSELLFGDKINVPPKVAIDEAIEIAKEFGGESSSRFVNGVMGAVYKELGEPGKNSVKKKQISQNKRIENKAGVFVFAYNNNVCYAAMILDVFGYWTFSKGNVEESETPEMAAKREAKEELGLEVNILEDIGSHEYIAHDPENGKTNKSIKYFLARSEYTDLVIGSSNGLVEAKWYTLEEIKDLKTYKDLKNIIQKGTEIIESGKYK